MKHINKDTLTPGDMIDHGYGNAFRHYIHRLEGTCEKDCPAYTQCEEIKKMFKKVEWFKGDFNIMVDCPLRVMVIKTEINR